MVDGAIHPDWLFRYGCCKSVTIVCACVCARATAIASAPLQCTSDVHGHECCACKEAVPGQYHQRCIRLASAPGGVGIYDFQVFPKFVLSVALAALVAS